MADRGAMFHGAAEVYDRFVGRYGRALARELIAAARVERGDRVLDVGCGPGALTTELAELVGAANVAAVDPSEPFVEACRTRAPGADVRVAHAESLPFEDGSFDVVLSQLVVNFLDDAERGLAEMRRVSRPDGTVASCVWDYGGGMTMLKAFWDAAVAVDADRAAPLMESRTMRFATAGELEALWREAGLEDIAVRPLVVEASYEDFDDLWAPFPTGVGPAGAYAASLDAEAQARLRDEYARRLGDPRGRFSLSARAWCAIGRA